MRLGQAHAKEIALARAEAARQRLERAKADAARGPAEPSMLAGLIARRIVGTAEDIARMIALMTAALAIAATVLMASLSHRAMALILDGLGAGVGECDARAIAPSRTATTHSPSAKRALAAAERLDLFIKEQVKPGAEGGTVAAKELRDALSTWWICRAPGKPVPTAKALGMAMTRCGLRSVNAMRASCFFPLASPERRPAN